MKRLSFLLHTRAIASNAALALAVSEGMRAFLPYKYRPERGDIPHDVAEARRTLRAALSKLELERALLDSISDAAFQGGSHNALHILHGELQQARALDFSYLSVGLMPTSAVAWISLGVAQIRSGALTMAAESLRTAEECSCIWRCRSRARANQAVVAELQGDLPRAAALALEAATMPFPSPLAVYNARIYSTLQSRQPIEAYA